MVKKAIFSLGIIGVVIVCGILYFTNSKAMATKEETKTLDGKEIKVVKVSSDLADIEVNKSEDDQIHVEVSGMMTEKMKEKAILEATTKGDQAVIEFGIPKSFFNFNFDLPGQQEVKLEVRLPEQVYEKIQVDSVLGNVTAKGLAVDEATFYTNTAAVELADLKGSKVDASFQIGSLTATNVDADLHIDGNTGDVNVTLDELNHALVVNGKMTDITVNAKNPFTSAAVNMETQIGDIDADFADLDAEKVNDKQMIGKVGSGEHSFNLTTNTGDIIVK